MHVQAYRRRAAEFHKNHITKLALYLIMSQPMSRPTCYVLRRICETVFIKPFKFLQERIPCLKCSCYDRKKTHGKLTSIFRHKKGISTAELFENEEENPDDNDEEMSEEDDWRSSNDEAIEESEETPQHKKVKKVGKAVRKAVGKGLIAYSDAALVTPMHPVGFRPGLEKRYYYSASFGAFL
ncbi:uncharacterized protein [Amphiura filiformis]|uniref:uncharacterized protein n=1 Tax=Amphiura filiformis TaxID=82378 RepID=UPI003B20EB3B